MPIGVWGPASSPDEDPINHPPDARSSDQEYKNWLEKVENKQKAWRKDPKNAEAVKRAAETRKAIAKENRAKRGK